MKGSPCPSHKLDTQFTPQNLAERIFNRDFSEVKIETCAPIALCLLIWILII